MANKTIKTWRKMRLGDFAEINPSVRLERGKQYPFMDMSEVQPLSRSTEWRTSKIFNGSGSRFENGDTLFARITPCLENGKITQALNLDEPGFGSTEFLILRGRKGISDSNFVYQLSKLHNIRKAAEQSMIGASGRQRVERAAFEKIEVRIPEDIKTQTRIAEILSGFDAKIELNNKTSRSLEMMAQTIFNEWFVKNQGDDWEAGKSTDFIDILSGGTPPTHNPSYWEGEIPFFTPKDAENKFYCLNTEKKITEDGLKHCNSLLYPQNTVFVTARGTVGKIAMAGVPMAMNQSCYALRGGEYLSDRFVFLLMKNIVTDLQKQATGGVFDTITISTFEHLNMVKPPRLIVEKFSRFIDPIFDQMLNLAHENEWLITSRDTFSSKLMNEEIKI